MPSRKNVFHMPISALETILLDKSIIKAADGIGPIDPEDRAPGIEDYAGDGSFWGSGKKKKDMSGVKNAAAAGLPLVGDLVTTILDKKETQVQPGQQVVNDGPSTGSMAAGGALKGAAAGMKAGGPLGAAVGGTLGLITGLIGGNKERKREERELKQIESANRAKYQGLELDPNLDPYGAAGAYYAEEGMLIDDQPPRRVKAVPAGYTLVKDYKNGIPGAQYYQKTTSTASTAASTPIKRVATSSGTGRSRGAAVGRKMASTSNMNDIVYLMDESTPKAVMTTDVNPFKITSGRNEGLFLGNDKRFTAVYPQRRSNEITDAGMLNTAKQPVMVYTNQPNSAEPDPNGPMFQVPGDVFSNKFTRGTNRIDTTGIGQYLVQPLAQKMEEGGEVEGSDVREQDPPAPEQAQQKMINIELGEIMIDPVTLAITRKFDNPNRHKSHARKAMHEPVGNFVQLPEGMMVVPADKAKDYERGDKLTRKSIILEILKNQRNNPNPVVPAPGSAAPQAEEGILVDDSGNGPGPGPSLITDGLKANDFQAWFNKRIRLETPLKVDGIAGPKTKAAWGKYGSRYLSESSGIGGKSQLGMDVPVDNNEVVPMKGINIKTDIPSLSSMEENMQPQKPGSSKKRKITEQAVAQALNFLPTAYGIFSRMGDSKAFLNTNPGFRRARGKVENLETNPSIEASRTAIDQTFADTMTQMNNINSPSVRSELGNIAGQTMKAKGELIQNATNAAKDARNNKMLKLADIDVQEGADTQKALAVLDDTLRRDIAQRRNITQAGLSELVKNFGAQSMDRARMNAINSILKNVKVKEDGTIDDKGGFVGRIMELLDLDPLDEQTTYVPSKKRDTVSKDKKGNVSTRTTVEKKAVQK